MAASDEWRSFANPPGLDVSQRHFSLTVITRTDVGISTQFYRFETLHPAKLAFDWFTEKKPELTRWFLNEERCIKSGGDL